MAENILEKIIKKKIEKIENLKKTTKLETLIELIDKNNSFIDFKDKIQKNINKNKSFIITPADGLAFLISAIIENLFSFKLFSIFFLKLINNLFVFIESFKESKEIDSFRLFILKFFF